jgi:hypothetical protein
MYLTPCQQMPQLPLHDSLQQWHNGLHPPFQMTSLIPPPPVSPSIPSGADALLPPFLQLNSRITFEHEGQYHKGFLGQCNGVYRFLFKSHVNKHKEEWGVPLLNLPSTWVDLCVGGILIPDTFHTLFCGLHLPLPQQLSTL